MLNVEEFEKKEKELNKEAGVIWGRSFLDGIIDYKSYIDAPVKLLWILKEPHGNSYIDLRDYYSYPKGYYPRWMSTCGNLMRLSWAILENAQRKADIYNFSQIPKIDTKECTIDGAFVLEYVAIININKHGGGTSTKKAIIDREYNRKNVKEFLLKQIELINPKIIINCHRVTNFINDQLGGNILNIINGDGYGFNNGRLIIDTGHPNVRGTITNKDYCNNILNIIAMRI